MVDTKPAPAEAAKDAKDVRSLEMAKDVRMSDAMCEPVVSIWKSTRELPSVEHATVNIQR